jgi:hypothetical protein
MRPHGVLKLIAAALAVSACSGDKTTGPARCEKPELLSTVISANESNALSFFLDARTLSADSVRISYATADVTGTSPSFSILGDTVRAFVLGLFPSTTYAVAVVAYNDCGSSSSGPVLFTTGALPSDIPAYRATGAQAAPGYTVFAAGNYGLVADSTGRIVWYHRFTNGPGLNFQAQPNGRYAARPSADPGSPGAFVEISPTGSVTRTLSCARGLSPRMHDLIAQTDGSYWLLCDETRTLDLTAQGSGSSVRVMGTNVQHVSSSGELMFEWSPFDHLEVDLSILKPEDLAGSAVNWTHGNAIDIDRDGNLIVSYRNLNEVIKVDTKSGAIMWRLGGKHSSFNLENTASPPFARQHGARASGINEIILLDNLGEAAFSRAERYVVDPASGTARIVGAYGYDAGLVAQIGGSAQLVGESHTLVSFGNGAGVQEYDSSGKFVWQLDSHPGYVFRAQRIRSLYTPGMGDPR